MKGYIEENINLKENIIEIPDTGKAVLQQQFILAQAIEDWIISVKEKLNN